MYSWIIYIKNITIFSQKLIFYLIFSLETAFVRFLDKFLWKKNSRKSLFVTNSINMSHYLHQTLLILLLFFLPASFICFKKIKTPKKQIRNFSVQKSYQADCELNQMCFGPNKLPTRLWTESDVFWNRLCTEVVVDWTRCVLGQFVD